jgi:enoyl-CoA hydratase
MTNEPLTGEEAERIGLVARCVPNEEVYSTALGVAQKLSKNSTSAIRWTKHALNNWLRLAGPSFDASLALEFLGFRLADAKAGLEAVRNRNKTRT